jgi:hypothetical protein
MVYDTFYGHRRPIAMVLRKFFIILLRVNDLC